MDDVNTVTEPTIMPMPMPIEEPMVGGNGTFPIRREPEKQIEWRPESDIVGGNGTFPESMEIERPESDMVGGNGTFPAAEF